MALGRTVVTRDQVVDLLLQVVRALLVDDLLFLEHAHLLGESLHGALDVEPLPRADGPSLSDALAADRADDR